MAASDWVGWLGSLTGGTGVSQWSTVNSDRARTGPGRPGQGWTWAGLGRAGPDTCRIFMCPRGGSGLLTGSVHAAGSRRTGAMVHRGPLT